MGNTDYFSKAWTITWKYKHLWVLGLLAGLQFGYNGNSGSSDLLQGGAWLLTDIDRYVVPSTAGAILAVAVSISLWLVGLISRAGLIQSVQAVGNRKEPPGLIASFRENIGVLGSLIVMQIIVWLPVILIGVFLTLKIQSAVASIFGIDGSTAIPQSLAPIAGLTVATALLTFILAFIEAFAFRSIILGHFGPLKGLQHGAKTLFNGIGSTVITTIVCGILGLAFAFIIGFPLLAVSTPIIWPLLESMQSCVTSTATTQEISECSAAISTAPRFLIPLLLFSVVGAAFNALWITFQSAVFTLLYQDLVHLPQSVERPAYR